MSPASFAFTYRGALVPIAAAAVFVFPGGEAGPASQLAALGVLAAGIALRVTGVRCIGGRARVHTAGARELATDGIFSEVRNPIYLGNIAYAAGLAALFASWMAAALLAVYLVALYTVIALHEEGVLLAQYGDSYRDYKSSVPRWLWRPRFSQGARGVPTPWRDVLKLERWFIVVGVFCAAASGIFTLRVSDTLLGGAPVWRLVGVGIVLLLSASLFVIVTRKVRRKRRRAQALAEDQRAWSPARV